MTKWIILASTIITDILTVYAQILYYKITILEADQHQHIRIAFCNTILILIAMVITAACVLYWIG